MNLLLVLMTIIATKTVSCCETSNNSPNYDNICSIEQQYRRRDSESMSNDTKYISVNFEVFGRVQGVFFRKYTQQQAKKLGVSGWCMNTEHGTVQGNIQGVPSKIHEMKNWLQGVGSPQSRIDKAVFTSDVYLKDKPNPEFAIRR